jgi:hypothetical protein
MSYLLQNQIVNTTEHLDFRNIAIDCLMTVVEKKEEIMNIKFQAREIRDK